MLMSTVAIVVAFDGKFGEVVWGGNCFLMSASVFFLGDVFGGDEGVFCRSTSSSSVNFFGFEESKGIGGGSLVFMMVVVEGWCRPAGLVDEEVVEEEIGVTEGFSFNFKR